MYSRQVQISAKSHIMKCTIRTACSAGMVATWNTTICCVYRQEKGSRREIKGGMAVLTSIPAAMERSWQKRWITLCASLMNWATGRERRKRVYPSQNWNFWQEPPTEQELLSVFYQQCLKHAHGAVLDFCYIKQGYPLLTFLPAILRARCSPWAWYCQGMGQHNPGHADSGVILIWDGEVIAGKIFSAPLSMSAPEW